MAHKTFGGRGDGRRWELRARDRQQQRREDTGRDTEAQAALDELRFERNVQLLHDLGARAVFELLRELAAARSIRSEIEALVERYGRLDAEIVRAIGGDRFPPRPLRMVLR
jgi:hypothetical protein